MQLLNILEEKYSQIISFLCRTTTLYVFPLERGQERSISREKAGRNSGFGLFAVNSTTCLIKTFSSSPVSIRGEKELRGKDVKKEK